MLVKCERCGKEYEVKVPKFCGKECRLANLSEMRKKKNDITPEVTTTDQVVSTPAAEGNPPVQQ